MTAGLVGAALLLAFLFHLGVAAVAVAILATAPALYLAWMALPATARKPLRGRLSGRWGPLELGVHPVIRGGPMPPYIHRPHDELLRAVLDPAVSASRLVVVRGGSSTGKTRAAYEAIIARLADWQLDYPLNAATLAARLDAGIPARTVLWLGELRQYADDSGGAAVLGRVADLLQGDGPLVITTIWPEQWGTYTAAARAGHGTADPAGVAGRLLERLPELNGRDPAGIDPARGGVIDVPDQFTSDDLHAVASTGDALLTEAATAATGAGQDGQVTQYLAGVPDLLARYDAADGDPYAQAVITAAIDATRLGHVSPLPAPLVQEAAVGYLTGPQRTEPIATWRDSALAWATAELRGAVRALRPVPPRDGTGVAGYQVADYLDQYGRRTRQDQTGPPSLWDALTTHTTTTEDLTRLGHSARDRGFYRHATALWTTATTLGSADAARQLISHLRQTSPGDTTRAANWAVDHVSLDDPWTIYWLLRGLREPAADDAATALATRTADHVNLDNPRAVARLVEALRDAGAIHAATALAIRTADHVNLDDPRAVAGLVEALRDAGAIHAATALAIRAAKHTSLDDSGDLAWLLRLLREFGAVAAATALATRTVEHISLVNPWGVTQLLYELRQAGTDDDAASALVNRTAERISLSNPWDVAAMLGALRQAGASDGAAALLARDPASHTSLSDPEAVAGLLRALATAGADDAVSSLATRAADHVSLDDPEAIGELLEGLREAGADDTAAALATRATDHVSLDDPEAVARLLLALLDAEADGEVTARLARDAARYVSLDNPAGVAWLLEELHEAGADDAPAALLARDPARHVSLDKPAAVGRLLRALAAAGADDAVISLATRAGAYATVGDPEAVAALLGALREAGADDTAAALATRAADRVSLDNPAGVAWLLHNLREAGADDAAAALLARDPARHVSLDNPEAVADLLEELRQALANETAIAVATRAASAGLFGLFLEFCPDQAASYPFGREPDGTPSQTWTWQKPASQNPDCE